ncbi:MAG: hypothetical protein V1798_05800 [Pseudomonadota bacterium]
MKTREQTEALLRQWRAAGAVETKEMTIVTANKGVASELRAILKPGSPH